jgi:cell division protein FtsL
MKRVPTKQRNFTVHRERDTRMFSRLLILFLCGAVLSGGFLFAASRHFKAINYGYKNEQLRKEHERLLEEQRRLMAERETAVSPVNLERAARQIGMKPASAQQINSATQVATEQKRQPKKRANN